VSLEVRTLRATGSTWLIAGYEVEGPLNERLEEAELLVSALRPLVIHPHPLMNDIRGGAIAGLALRLAGILNSVQPVQFHHYDLAQSVLQEAYNLLLRAREMVAIDRATDHTRAGVMVIGNNYDYFGYDWSDLIQVAPGN